MAEYVVIGSLVAVAAIASVIGAANQLDDWLKGLKGDLRGNIAAADRQKQLDDLERQRLAALNTEAKKSGGKSISDMVKGYEQVCFNGGCVNVPVIEGGPVQTSGGNGGQLTKEFANVLKQLAESLENDPQADPALVSMIRKLANQGHAMGDYQSTSLKGGTSSRQDNVVQQCSGGGDNQSCTEVTSDGRQISYQQMGGGDNGYTQKVVGGPSTNPYGSSIYSPYARQPAASAQTTDPALSQLQGPMLTEFKQQYQAIQDYIAANPNSISGSAANLISQETKQITAIVGGYKVVSTEDAAVSTITEGGGDNGSSRDVVNTTTNTTYTTNAELTHQSSNTICKNGAKGNGCTR